jgi:uncharacterized protein (TIGR01777 family)
VRIAITGASGFIGRALSARLTAAGHSILPIRLREHAEVPPADAVIHLAGEPVAQRWTATAKRRIRESRVEGTLRLVESMARLSPPPATLVSASAVGIYGSRGDETLTEESAPGADFLAGVCVDWERAAGEAAALGVRVVTPRIGMVLGHGGALARMLLAFKLGLGGRLGSGRQWMSWIHINDLAALIEFALGKPVLRGPVNATAPNPVTNAEFTRVLAYLLHRPAFLPVPAFALKLAFGEMASVLLASQRVLPQAAQAAGFRFEHPQLGPALATLRGTDSDARASLY